MAIKIGFVHELNISSNLVQKFYKENWPTKIALSNKKFYDWQFISPPSNSNNDFCVVAYDQVNKKILGAMGLNKRDFYLCGKKKYGAELTTWVVSKDSIGSGFGVKILLYIQKNFEILIGMGISETALSIYMRLGFRYLKSIPRFVKIVNFDNIKDYSQYNNLASKLISMWKPKINNDFFVKPFDNEKYSEIEKLLKHHSNHFSRDIHHLVWRYKNHPYFNYKEFLIINPNTKLNFGAYVSLREELSLSEFRVLHVMDIFGDENCILSGVKFIQNYAIENNIDVIDFYCTSSFVFKHFLAQGWFSINDDISFRFPHLFHPIELREPPTTSLIYWSKDNFEDLADLSKLYITKQDADLDRPTGYTLKRI